MEWSIAKAKERFSEVLRKSALEPQPIYNRDRLVAAVISAESFKEFSAWQSRKQQRSLAVALEDLRAILAEEGYALETLPRRDRPNAFADDLDELSR